MSSRSRTEERVSVSNNFFLSRIINMFAFSKVLRLAMFKKFLNSDLELLPEPSAILFDMDIPALRNCSANRNNLISSSLSAISNNIMPISIDSFHISKS